MTTNDTTPKALVAYLAIVSIGHDNSQTITYHELPPALAHFVASLAGPPVGELMVTAEEAHRAQDLMPGVLMLHNDDDGE